jgi:hypothetical protein
MARGTKTEQASKAKGESGTACGLRSTAFRRGCFSLVAESLAWTFVEHLMHYLKPHLLEARRRVLEDADDELDSD